MWLDQQTVLLTLGLSIVTAAVAGDHDDIHIVTENKLNPNLKQNAHDRGSDQVESEDNSLTLRIKREYSGPHNTEESSEAPEASYEDQEQLNAYEPQTKRFFSLLRNRATKAEGSKRGPGFRSWGGKRSKFSSWGGKRNEEPTMATSKREAELPMLFEQFQKRGTAQFSGKRRPFQSWGGKRAFYVRSYKSPYTIAQDDLRKLLSWEGKRKFSSWGGKRTIDGYENMKEKRLKPSFRSWGGKRSEEDEDMEENVSTLDG